MNTPFTYEQAAEIAEDFEDLVDTEYLVHGDTSKKFIIDYAGIAPYPQVYQRRFLVEFADHHDAQLALSQYEGSEYEVLVISQNVADAGEIAITPIRDYVAQNGITYSFD